MGGRRVEGSSGRTYKSQECEMKHVSIIDWILEKLNLTNEDETKDVEEEKDDISTWLEVIGRKKMNDSSENAHIFYKKIMTYDDARKVIEEYKSNAECIIRFNQNENSDSQGMMNYICGGVFALGGHVRSVGGNVFIISRGGEKEV